MKSSTRVSLTSSRTLPVSSGVGNEATAEALFGLSKTAKSELEIELRVVLVLGGRYFRLRVFCLGTYAILLFSDSITATGADVIEANNIKKERGAHEYTMYMKR